MCHGIHYHVGVQSGDASVATANSLAIQLPLFIALSASSPFWLDTKLIENNEGDNRGITDLIEIEIVRLESAATILGCTEQLVDLRLIVANGNSATRQRR